MACWPGSDGQTAALLSLVQVALYSRYILRTRDTGMMRLAVFGAVFGTVELAADALCIRFTGTLDYSPAHSLLLGLSPWWMPLAWTIVAMQIGCLGAWAIGRFGVWRGAILGATLGLVNIPFYEEMAYHAHWWQYIHCRMFGHTPFYIVIAEGVIGLALGPLAALALNSRDFRQAALLGILGGLSTIAGGMIGYGLVEFIPRLFLK